MVIEVKVTKMDFNVAYEKWLQAWLNLAEAVIDAQSKCIDIDNKAPEIIKKHLIAYNENIQKHRKIQWGFYEQSPQALHLACKGEFLALKQAELDARHRMFNCTHCFETKQFYGQSMNLVEVIDYCQTECWQTVINTVNRYRDMGFTVEVKYCAFDGNSKLFDSSWGAYYIYANVNDVRKFLYGSYPYETQNTQYMELVYPPVLPLDNTHHATYTNLIDI